MTETVTEADDEQPERRRPRTRPAGVGTSVPSTGGQWPMADRAVLATVLGIRPIFAVGFAAALTAIGVLVDLTRIGSLGLVFTICYITGCVLAVAWVRRDGLFGPMVQPPLLVAAAVPIVVLLAGDPRPGQGVADRLLVIGAPLVNAFPIMAWTTAAVVAAGAARMFLQRPLEPPAAPAEAAAKTATKTAPKTPRDAKAAKAPDAVSGRRNGRGAAREAGRTSGSPRQS